MKRLLYRLYRQLTLGGIKNFNKPSDAQEWFRFLEGLTLGSTPEQRSLNKYYCRMHYFGFFYKLLVNAGSIVGILIKVIPNLLKRKTVESVKETEAVLVEYDGINYDDIIPDELTDRYPDMVVVKDERKNLHLSKEATQWFLGIWKKNIFKPYYILWVFKELAFFSKLLEKYKPKSIIVYVYERSVVSPIITAYLESHGTKFINFMHGDYTLQLIHAFSEFSEFYVWDPHYIITLGDYLCCPPDQFKVYRPQKLQKKYSTNNETIDLTYYLGSESDLTLERLGKLFSNFEAAGIVCQVRKHPRRQNYDQIAKHFHADQIQDPKIISIEKSITQTQFIASLNSTVMSEAYYGGKKIVLDDWTDPQKYQSYVSRRGITSTMYDLLLSEFVVMTLGEGKVV